MKRLTYLLIAVLALVVSACGGTDTTESSAPSEAAATVEPTPDPTPEPVEPEESAEADNGGTDTALLDLLPDQLDGQDRLDVDMANNPMITAAFEAQNIDASDFEYTVSTYGTGEDVIGVTAMRIPQYGQTQLEQIARLMTGMAEGQGSADVVSLGGKDVLALSANEVDEAAYMYFIDGAVFVIGGGSEDLVAELLSQLP